MYYQMNYKKISYIPFIGFLSGGITTGKHIYNHKKDKNKSEAKLTEIPIEADSGADNPQIN